MTSQQKPDPKWGKMWAEIVPEEGFPHIHTVTFEVYYAGRPWHIAHKVDTRFPDEIPFILNDMVDYLDEIIEGGNGMPHATLYTLDSENHEALRNNGFGQNAIDAFIARDKEWGIKTQVLVKEPINFTAGEPLSRSENALAYQILNSMESASQRFTSDVFPVVKMMTHPDVLPYLEALIEASNPTLKKVHGINFADHEIPCGAQDIFKVTTDIFKVTCSTCRRALIKE